MKKVKEIKPIPEQMIPLRHSCGKIHGYYDPNKVTGTIEVGGCDCMTEIYSCIACDNGLTTLGEYLRQYYCVNKKCKRYGLATIIVHSGREDFTSVTVLP